MKLSTIMFLANTIFFGNALAALGYYKILIILGWLCFIFQIIFTGFEVKK
jgi:hypothetical protein